MVPSLYKRLDVLIFDMAAVGIDIKNVLSFNNKLDVLLSDFGDFGTSLLIHLTIKTNKLRLLKYMILWTMTIRADPKISSDLKGAS